MNRDDLRTTLADQRLAPSSVPAVGHPVPLKGAIIEGAIADEFPATDLLWPSIIDDSARGSAAGPDSSPSISSPRIRPSRWRAPGGCVLEVDTTPGLIYHSHQRRGQFHVARVILERLIGSA